MNNKPRYFNRWPQVLLITLAYLLIGANSAVADLNEGLVGYWNFDEGSGEAAYDGSGHGNDGTVFGATWTTGISGAALHFNGVDDYVRIGPSAILEADSFLTISVWLLPIGPGSNPTWGGIIVNKEGEYEVNRLPNGTIAWALANSDPGWTWTLTGFVAPEDVWTHIILVYDAGQVLFYANGDLVFAYGGAGLIGDFHPDEDELRIGSRQFPTLDEHFEGRIDEVRIYNRALSDGEIRDLYWSVRPDPPEDTTDGDKSDVSGTSKDPVNTATGSFFHQETDLSIPSRGSPLIFTRFYNSKAAAPGRKAVKSKQAPQKLKTATSQPASTKQGKLSSVDAKKQDESAARKDQKQIAGSSQARPKMKERSK